jgi:hypothetical protein
MIWKVSRIHHDSRSAVVYLALTLSGLTFVLLGLSIRPTPQSVARPLEIYPNHLGLGSNGTSDHGWLIPANTTIATTYLTNSSIAGYINGVVNVFPTNDSSKAQVTIGLYDNGLLLASRTVNLGKYHPRTSTVVASLSAREDRFSGSLMGLTVSPATITTIQAGTKIAVTISSNVQIWVQIDDSAKVHSYVSQSAGQVLPSILSITKQETSHTISVGIESHA